MDPTDSAFNSNRPSVWLSSFVSGWASPSFSTMTVSTPIHSSKDDVSSSFTYKTRVPGRKFFNFLPLCYLFFIHVPLISLWPSLWRTGPSASPRTICHMCLDICSLSYGTYPIKCTSSVLLQLLLLPLSTNIWSNVTQPFF